MSERTRAVIPVHLAGWPADIDAILSVARASGLAVIEDCAQAHGATYKDKRVGSMGDIGCFSFYPTKNLGAIGDGGALVTNDDHLAQKIKLLREYGWEERYISSVKGWNSRLDELQAAVLRVKLPYLDADTEKRRLIARKYNEAFQDFPMISPLVRDRCCHAYHLYVVAVDKRDELVQFLKNKNVFVGIHYPTPVHRMPAYANCTPAGVNLSQTDALVGRVLSLPMYPELTVNEQEQVISAIREFYFR